MALVRGRTRAAGLVALANGALRWALFICDAFDTFLVDIAHQPVVTVAVVDAGYATPRLNVAFEARTVSIQRAAHTL